nr:phage tail protein [Pantoea sp. 201603H]
MRERPVTEEELIDFGLLKQGIRQWKFRFSVGSPFICASSKERAIEGAIEAYLKARPGTLMTKEQRYEKAVSEEIQSSEAIWGHLKISELIVMFSRMGGDISSLQKSAGREFNNNGGRRTACAVSVQGARDTAEMRMKLERYIEYRRGGAA